jgi:hypothetical protein
MRHLTMVPDAMPDCEHQPHKKEDSQRDVEPEEPAVFACSGAHLHLLL